MFVSIDTYYGVEFYKQCIEALKNNEVSFKEFISIKSPFKWWVKLDTAPIMVNYDIASKEEERFLINKVIPNRPNSEYLLLRRDDISIDSLKRYTENEPFQKCRSTGLFFKVQNKAELLRISKDYPKKIWFIGKYYNNKYNVCMAEDSIIKNFLPPESVLLENTFKEYGRFEVEFNWKILLLKERIVKFTETPYALNGQYITPKVWAPGQNNVKFILI